MFRERPLTWLLIIATVAVDWVLLIAASEGSLASALRIGFVLGQLAAVAIWTVRGHLHRLARISCLVVATGGLSHFINASPESGSAWLAFNSGYVLFIALAAIGGRAVAHRLATQLPTKIAKLRRQVPLIEFFGLTVVVAIISFGARSMDFGFLEQRPLLFVVALAAVPIAMALFVRRDLRDLGGRKAIVITAVVIATATYLGRVEAGGESLIFAQTAYLALAMAVLAMDDVLAQVKKVGNRFRDNDLVSSPELYHPQD